MTRPPRASPRLRALAALVLAAVPFTVPARSVVAQAGTPQETPAGDATDLVNTLLAGLLGFRDLTGPELQQEVADAGGIAFRSDVALQYLGRSELSGYLKDVLDTEYPEEKARADQRVLVAFDLLPADTDLRALRARVLEENIAGFYDERAGRKRLYVVSDDQRLTPANQLILAHEMRHALQDQYVDVGAAVPDAVGDFDDRRLAWISLLEGDATLVMERFLARRLPVAGDGAGDLFSSMPVPPVPGAPPVVRDQLVLPYLVGRDFARALWQQGGWDAVRAAWARPPESMEQVLHPEKYAAREPPQRVDVGGAPRGARPLAEGVLGEMLIRTLLGEGHEEAALGWGGDAYRAFDVQGRTLLLWRSLWDTPAAEKTFRYSLLARFSETHGASSGGQGVQVFTKGAWHVGFVSRGEGVALVASDDPQAFSQAIHDVR